MTKIESDSVKVNQPQEKVFNFLSDFNNFESLMPEQVINWQSDSDTCKFEIKGMATLGMAYESKEPSDYIKIRRDGKAPFDFFLNCYMDDDDGGTKLKLVFDADLNPMLQMMATKPLTNFLNLLTGKLAEICATEDLELLSENK